MRVVLIDIVIPEKHFFSFFICELDSKFRVGWNHSIIAKFAGKCFIYHVKAKNSSFFFWIIRLSCSQKTCTVRSHSSWFIWLTFIFSALNRTGRHLPVVKYILLFFCVQPENNLCVFMNFRLTRSFSRLTFTKLLKRMLFLLFFSFPFKLFLFHFRNYFFQRFCSIRILQCYKFSERIRVNEFFSILFEINGNKGFILIHDISFTKGFVSDFFIN